MMEHPVEGTLNDLVDGELSPPAERAVRLHLAGCGECRSRLQELREAVDALGSLPASAAPPTHLWAGIRERIEDRGAQRRGSTAAPGRAARDDGEAEILAFPGGENGRETRRYALSLGQLAAAASLVALLSAGVVWMALDGGGGPGAPVPATAESVPASGAALRAASTRQAGYERVVQDLELLVEQGREVLAHETVASLEESLATVDAALAEVRAALAEDPASPLLQRMLVGHQTTRVRVLRQAVTAIESRS